jgi:tetratricopeptide (TPR) repeat protein
MLQRQILTIGILLLTLMGVSPLLWAADAPLATFTLDVSRETVYTVKKGGTAGELLLDLENPPSSILDQLEKQVGEHLVAVKVADRDANRLVVKLILKPVIFEFSHGRQIDPHRIIVDILPANAQSGLSNAPSTPPLPMWEMSADGSFTLPDPNYEAVSGEGDSYQAFMSAVRLYGIGAYEAAIKRLTENLKVASDPMWNLNLVLYADVLFQVLRSGEGDAERVRRTLMVAEREAHASFFKARSALMIGYTFWMEGNAKEAAATFTRVATQYPELADAVLLGQLQIALDSRDQANADNLVNVLKTRPDLSEHSRRKVCFAGVMLTLNKARILEANEAADRCLAAADPDEPLIPEHLLIVAESRLLGYRWADAKRLMESVVRNYPDHQLAPLAAMRATDVLDYERKHDPAILAYEAVYRRWPLSPYGRLAMLRADELERFKVRDPNVTETWTSLDLHHEDDMIARQARLRLMWLYDEMGRHQIAYGYLVELVRRFNGKRYWAFAERRFTELVLNAYRELDREGDFLSVINQYSAEIDLPLDDESLDEISTLAAKAYAGMGYWKDSIRILLKALDRPGRPIEGERELLMSLTRAYIATGDFYRAEKTQQYFHSRFSTESDSRDYYYMQGEIAELRNDMDSALEAYNMALTFETSVPRRRQLGLKIGRTLYLKKDYPGAIEALSAALERYLDPNVVFEGRVVPRSVKNALYFLADSLTRQQLWQDALTVWQRTVALFPDDDRTPIAHYYSARCLLKLGQPTEAVGHYEAMAEAGDFWGTLGALNKDIAQWFLKHDMNQM